MLGAIDETLTMEKNIRQTTRNKILEQIRQNPAITRNELAVLPGLTPDGIKYHLQKITKEEIIVHKGSNRKGYWQESY